MSALLAPVIVTANMPGGVVMLVWTVMVEEPEPFTDLGLKLALAPAASPRAPNVTVPVNASKPVTVAV